KAQNNYEVAAKRIKHKNPPEDCNNCHTIRTGIPCVHKIQMYLLEKELVDPGDFHVQWHLKAFFYFLLRLKPYKIKTCGEEREENLEKESLDWLRMVWKKVEENQLRSRNKQKESKNDEG
ncbi:uncharacterized protein VP01_654g3, partial [Puccinia sorghi]